MCKIIIAEKENEKFELVKLARKNRLYVPNECYHLFRFFKKIMDSYDFYVVGDNFVEKISIAFEGGVAVGVCLLIKDGRDPDGYSVETFVKRQFRRKGIGTLLLRRTKRGVPRENIIGYETGMPQAKLFWKKNKIKTL